MATMNDRIPTLMAITSLGLSLLGLDVGLGGDGLVVGEDMTAVEDDAMIQGGVRVESDPTVVPDAGGSLSDVYNA